MVQAVRFALTEICAEAQGLVKNGRISKRQPIADLAKFYSAAEWQGIYHELCLNDYCLTSPVGELTMTDDWSED